MAPGYPKKRGMDLGGGGGTQRDAPYFTFCWHGRRCSEINISKTFSSGRRTRNSLNLREGVAGRGSAETGFTWRETAGA